MIIPEEVLAGFFYLSNITDDSLAEKEADIIKSALHFIPESYRQWFSLYIDYQNNYESYPEFAKIKQQMGFENEITLSFQMAQELYQKQLSIWESNYLANKLTLVPLAERRDILIKMSQVLSADTQVSVPLESLDTFSVEGTIIKKESGNKRFFDLFTQHLNNTCIVNPGTVISIIAPPAMGKTSCAINLIYLNSIIGNLNSLYIYLENTVDAYNIELMSRHSYTNGMLVENATLKRGIDPDEPMAVQKVKELQQALNNDKKGNIFFAPFSRFNPEPLRFANQLGKYVSENNIQVVVVDYLQRCKSYTPLRWDSREYINQLMSAFSSCALGAFGSPPFVAIMLSQPTRAAEEKLLKTKGTGMTVFDAVEAPSIERDSFIVLGLYADPELRSNRSMVYKILKNRDQASDINTVLTTAIPQYCFLGDVSSNDSTPTYTQEDAQDLLSLEIW